MSFNGNFMCTTFKQGLLNGDFDFSSDTSHVFKIALYTNSAVPTDFGGSGTEMNASVTKYATNNEVSGTGYSAGGGTLAISTNPTTSGTTAFLDFTDETFSTATITARGAIIYRSDASAPTNDACIVLDFGSDKTSTAGDFTIVFPTADASNAIIRIA
jgi:hypothetical protein